MKNPWEEIDLEIYESHMRLDSVMQLQAMNAIMKKQLEAYPAATAMILGVAGGNGLEHIRRGNITPSTAWISMQITFAQYLNDTRSCPVYCNVCKLT